jgi:hypothetical protein
MESQIDLNRLANQEKNRKATTNQVSGGKLRMNLEKEEITTQDFIRVNKYPTYFVIQEEDNWE